MTRLYITPGDNTGWAIDEDARLMRAALEGLVSLCRLEEADTVLSTWFVRLAGGPGQKAMPEEALAGKRVLCWSPNRPFHDAGFPGFGRARDLVGRWLVGSRQAEREMSALGLAASYIPYLVDTSLFFFLEKNNLAALRDELGIPEGSYVIGNFFRDSEGACLSRPKLQKGPDHFLEIVSLLRRRGLPVHVLLAGPRRHWLRHALSNAGVPFSFAGQVVPEDDLALNTLPRERVNLLYNLLDLCLVPSRWEGGPHAILEAAASGTRILSTRVGIAEDVLEPDSLFDSPDEAAKRIEEDISSGLLATTRSIQKQRVLRGHVPDAARDKWAGLIAELPRIRPRPQLPHPLPLSRPPFLKRLTKRIRKRRPPSISLWNEFVKPPYGGGNQFMMALGKELKRQGIDVAANNPRADVHVVNSVQFDVQGFRRRFGRKAKPRVIHRIDGPIQLYRGTSQELDELCFELNKEFAFASVIQSAWTFTKLEELGFEPVRPVILRNAADPDIFNPYNRVMFDRNRKVRLISTSWSSNARKGGQIYKWLDAHLDWSRFDYTFLGNVSEKLSHIRHLPPAGSEEVAAILRQHDIYITASMNDPCSNALIEALSCGLPALYLNSGGHSELVGLGGLAFDQAEDIPALLDRLVEHYAAYQLLVSVPKIEDVAGTYLQLAIEAFES